MERVLEKFPKMRVGYLECFAGISGDMLMAALVDAGTPFTVLNETAASLGLGAELVLSKVGRSGIEASKIDVLVDGKQVEGTAGNSDSAYGHQSSHHSHGHSHSHHKGGQDHHVHGRGLVEIRGILRRTSLNQEAQALALRAFDLLGEAEARIHGGSLDQIHFHEVGTIDAIVDVACCAAAINVLALDEWYSSPVNTGSGFVDCTHGRFPVPAPATAELLKNIPCYADGPRMEMTTPTGAALLSALHCRFGRPNTMRTHSIGYGAGSRDPERFPNVLRLNLGEMERDNLKESSAKGEEKIMVIECAIDDLSPEVLAHAARCALDNGALDVMSTPVAMKKGRVGTLLTVLAKPTDAAGLERLLFRETSTLGIRVREDRRLVLERSSVEVETEFGMIRVKLGSWQGERMNAAPEFEDCRLAATRFDVPLKTVIRAALAAWHNGSRSQTSVPAGEVRE
ncbi:MAG: nickel pincer cofactor biosynthesis protein LarC [Acidobacteriaceae bacterium]